jgi:hypothetical protein
LALSKTVGADSVWEVNATNGADGIHGPVYVAEANEEIVFKTVTRFIARPSTSSLTNIALTGAVVGSGNTSTQFTATSDIVIEFDRPVATVNRAQLRYYRGGEYYTQIESYRQSDDKTVLYITPANMLAPDSTFVVRLDVVAEDGQQIVYDSTNTGDSTTWANGTDYNQDLRIRTTLDPIFTGIPTLRQPASNGSLATTPPTGNIAKTATTMDLTFTLTAAQAINFEQNYTVYVRRFDLWSPAMTGISTPVDNVLVESGALAPTSTPVTVDIPDDGVSSPYNHFNGEGIQYKIRGINNSGYVVEATSRVLPFAP